MLLIFVTYLTHGFIPHHHHPGNPSPSFDIHFCQNAESCTCHESNLHQELEFHSDCLFCDQLQKELNNQGFVKEPVLSLNIAFLEELLITPRTEIKTEYNLISDLKILVETEIQTHGLRAPPIA